MGCLVSVELRFFFLFFSLCARGSGGYDRQFSLFEILDYVLLLVV